MSAPATARTGAGPTCRDCDGELAPSDPPDVHSGAMHCIRVLRLDRQRLQLELETARAVVVALTGEP